jgi:hypothetical protein
MPRAARLFNVNDFNRLVDSARRKGLPIKSIEARRDGLSLIVGEPAKAGDEPASQDTTALEQWRAKHRGQG